VAGVRDEPLEEDRRVAKKRSARVRAVSYAARSSGSSRATDMPMPPPPAAGLTMTG
jgi:hypothetical protein